MAIYPNSVLAYMSADTFEFASATWPVGLKPRPLLPLHKTREREVVLGHQGVG